METRYNSPITKKQFFFTNTKLSTPKFHSIKLYKSNQQLSKAITDIKNINNNFSFKIKRNQKIKLKRDNKPIQYNSEDLKNDLMSFRAEAIKRKNELIKLKIKCGRLMIDNVNNKTLIANILGIPKNKYLTKDTVIKKIKNCKMNKEEKESLKTSYEILKLKSEFNNKKTLLSEKAKYLEILNKNSKLKNISILQDEFNNKCEQEKSLIKKLSSLGKKYSQQQNLLSEMKEKLKMQNITSENLLELETQGVDKINQMLDQKVTLIKQIYSLKDKIKKHKKSYFSKEKENIEKERNNSFDEQKLNILNEYSKIRLEEETSISQMTKNNEADESVLKNYSEEIALLQKEYNNLYLQLNNYKEEKPKLIFKSKEPKKNIEKMESLKKELIKLKELKIETEQKNNKIQNELKKKNNDYNIDNEMLSKKIEDNINTKNKLDKKIQELNETKEKLNNKSKEIISKINQAKEEYDKLIQNEKELKIQIEQNSLLNQENIQNKEKEKKDNMIKLTKKRKNEIDNLKNEQNKLIHSKKNLEDENNYLKQELDGFNQSLNEYEKIEQELTDANHKLNNMKNK